MNVQWYPGHMTKARRIMEENLKLVDVIVEIRDARIPLSSANPDLGKMGSGKQRILVLNKADLADPAVTESWTAYFRAQSLFPVCTDSREKKMSGGIMKQLEALAAEKAEADAKRGIKNRPVRIMIAGIPNVGKSTLINTLAGKASAKTGDKPGVTRGLQWIRLAKNMEMLDTPGILWPKFEDRNVGIRLALMGAVSEDVLPLEALCAEGYRLLEESYPGLIEKKYRLGGSDTERFTEVLAAKQGLLKKGGLPDTEKAAKRFLDDWQKGRLGRISLERPPREEEKEA